jgi:tetratricopeptide (TPR) repeat protein
VAGEDIVQPTVQVARLSEITPISVADVQFQPVRHTLGVRAFGINGYSAHAAGDHLIEPHDETGPGSGGQEELYFVVSGRAAFTVDGAEVDAPAGTLVFVPDVKSKRSAVAAEDATTVLVVGGPADRPLPVSPFEYWYRAQAPYLAGDLEQAAAIASEGLEQWPDHGQIHYQLACFHALAGQHEPALEHLARATESQPRTKAWAREDEDFDSIRDDPAFERIVG